MKFENLKCNCLVWKLIKVHLLIFDSYKSKYLVLRFYLTSRLWIYVISSSAYNVQKILPILLPYTLYMSIELCFKKFDSYPKLKLLKQLLMVEIWSNCWQTCPLTIVKKLTLVWQIGVQLLKNEPREILSSEIGYKNSKGNPLSYLLDLLL